MKFDWSEYNWKNAEALLLKLSKNPNLSWPWENFTVNERCALHELRSRGLVTVCSDVKSRRQFMVQITEEGRQEVFLKVL